MSDHKVTALPEYTQLNRKKRVIVIPLTLLMLLTYYTFILLVAYTPDLLAVKMADGITSLGIALGLGIILLTLGITAFYVWYANKHLEPLIKAIHKKAGRNE